MQEIVAVVGDASMYHVDCARTVYGAEVVNVLTADDSVERAFSDEWPQDNEGNDLTVVLADSDDLTDDTDTPHSCGHCNGYLIADERVTDSTLARDILNLTVDARDGYATRMASWAASVARKYDTSPDTLLDILRSRPVFSSDVTGMDMLKECITLAEEWVKTWNERTILQLHRNADGMLINSEGDEYAEYDMRGCLDMYADGQEACQGCGRRIVSHCFHFAEWDEGAYCPDCVVVE